MLLDPSYGSQDISGTRDMEPEPGQCGSLPFHLSGLSAFLPELPHSASDLFLKSGTLRPLPQGLCTHSPLCLEPCPHLHLVHCSHPQVSARRSEKPCLTLSDCIRHPQPTFLAPGDFHSSYSRYLFDSLMSFLPRKLSSKGQRHVHISHSCFLSTQACYMMASMYQRTSVERSAGSLISPAT